MAAMTVDRGLQIDLADDVQDAQEDVDGNKGVGVRRLDMALAVFPCRHRRWQAARLAALIPAALPTAHTHEKVDDICNKYRENFLLRRGL